MTTPSLFRIWISAARLRTLPLSVAGILTGNALAIQKHSFSWMVFGGTLLTAIAFQILSNFANDYGDGVKGADNENRIGPKRVLQQNLLSKKVLFNGILLAGLIGFLLALGTIMFAFGLKEFQRILVFLGLSIAAIFAAYKYTAGKGAYGYYALGDLFVLLFFGGLAVMGSYYLQTDTLPCQIIWFAMAVGCLSVGVLNLNNMRDMENDATVGKKTIAALLGFNLAKTYHAVLLLTGLLCLGIGLMQIATTCWHYLPLVIGIPLLFQLSKTLRVNTHTDFDVLLKPLALITFALSLILLITQLSV